MANEEHLAILEQGVEAWNKWRKENPTIRPDLSRAKLSGADLIWADLSGADLTGADLSGADLSVANLSGADLSGAKLIEADFWGAKLIEADLRGAQLVEARLSVADLIEADLSGAIVGATEFGSIDLSAVKGLDRIHHARPSTIGIDTLYLSRGKIPEVFLRGCGVPDRMIAFIASLTGQPETDRTRLRLNLDKYFNESELQTLCFDMGVDYDGLGGENKSDKVRELVAYFQRRGTIRNLVAKCKVLRPNVPWEGEYE